MPVASEDIAPGDTLPDDTCTENITVTYYTSTDLPDNAEIRFTLLEGSEPGDAVFFTNSNSSGVSDISPGTLTIQQTSSSATVALISGGETENTMAFRIQDVVSKESTMTFTFCIADADVLQDPNQSINLKIEFLDESGSAIAGETVGTQSVLLAKNGSDGIVNAGIDDGDVKVDVGSESGAKKFSGSSIDQTEQLTAILGEVCFQEKIPAPYASDLAIPWVLSNKASGATFSITDAPFNASIGHEKPADLSEAAMTDEQLAGVMVFLDTDGDSLFTAEDIPADSVDTTSASFTISGSTTESEGYYNGENQITRMLTANANSNVKGLNDNTTGCVAVVFKVSGNDEIKTLDVAPTGKLTVSFSTGRVITGKLNHIQRSGTVCVLYNIPGPNSIENANIRVTNKSATPDGTLYGTLRLPDGTEIFSNYDILTAAGLGLIGSNQTIYFNTDTLNTIAQSSSNPNGAWADGWSRAILRLETNLDTVEMMALIRDDDVLGAPLMNMSTGASGNGCGR
jgi:hypothetical protein